MKKKFNFVRLLTLVLVMAISTFAVRSNVLAVEYTNVDNADDFKTAVEAGESVKLISDIELSTVINITNDNVTIDLNGKVLSYESDVAGEAMITNSGDLTITDTTDKADGKILFKYVGEPDTNYGKGNYTISNVGTLVLENGIVENATDKMSHACYAIDNNANNSVANLTINGGKVINTYNYAIRQVTASRGNHLTINGGTVSGTRAIWIQLAGSDTSVKPEVSLTVNGGSLIGTGESSDYKLAVYSYSYGNVLENVEINVLGGVLDGDLAISGGKNKTISEVVNITGGKITDVYGYAADEVTRIEITGGTFAKEISATYIKTGYELNKVTDGYSVVKIVPKTDLPVVDADETPKEAVMGVVDSEENKEVLLDSLKDNEEFAELVETQSVTVTVDVADVKEEELEEDVKEAISELVGKDTIAKYFDISVLVKDTLSDREIGSLSELNDFIKLMILLPEELKNTDKDILRTYYVIRRHMNGNEAEYEKIPATLSEDGKYLTFETSKFSVYALAYNDAENPKTFDGLLTNVGLGVVSLVGMIGAGIYLTKKQIKS